MELFRHEANLEVCGEAENGHEAIEKARQLHPGLIVLDVSMPVMNGLDAARVLRGIMPTVPLILYSAFSDYLVQRQLRLMSCSELVSKSDPVSVLIAKAHNLLHKTAA